MKVRELRIKITEYLKERNHTDAEADASVLLMKLLGIDKTALIMGDIDVPKKKLDIAYSHAERLVQGEPIRYITGECEFMSLPFYVKKGVLIPRCDTEALVDETIDRLPKDREISVLDIGCGSGCIGISLAYYMKNIKVTGIDISDVAIDISKKNAVRNGVSERVSFEKCDIMTDVPKGKYDCILSNPPYIKTNDISGLDVKIKKFEPISALDGGADGLEFYRKIVTLPCLKKGGLMILEAGFDTTAEVKALLDANGYNDTGITRDAGGNERVAFGILS